MDGLDIRDLSGADDRRNIEIAFSRTRWPDADRLVGEAYRQRVTIGFTVDGDGADSKFLARADHAKSDFSAIGDQNLIEHALEEISQPVNAGEY